MWKMGLARSRCPKCPGQSAMLPGESQKKRVEGERKDQKERGNGVIGRGAEEIKDGSLRER